MIKSFLLYILFIIVLILVSYTFGMAVAHAEPIKIAIIDTGYDFDSTWHKDNPKSLMNKHNLQKPVTCKTGHKDFTNKGLKDNHGHGTHLAGLIAKYAITNYCIIIIKYWHNENSVANGFTNVLRLTKSINWAIAQDVDIINFSGGGLRPFELEKKAVIKALDKGIVFVAAGGNERFNLAIRPYYPALYDSRIIVVGNVKPNGKRGPSSNFGGAMDLSVTGTDVMSLLPDNRYGWMTGTSQSTAIVTGRIVQQVYVRKLLKHSNEHFGSISTDNYTFRYEKYTAR